MWCVTCSSVEDSASNDEPPAPMAPPTQTTSDDDFQYMNEFRDEDFQGSGKCDHVSLSLHSFIASTIAAAQFDVEYLESLGNNNPSHVSSCCQ